MQALLRRVGLSEAEGLYPHEMSGGMQRRLALARALALPGDALLLDEPFTGLDGQRVLGVDYKADFDYERKTAPDRYGNIYWLRVTEDVKGVRTESYSIKARMFHARYGYAITEISARRYR